MLLNACHAVGLKSDDSYTCVFVCVHLDVIQLSPPANCSTSYYSAILFMLTVTIIIVQWMRNLTSMFRPTEFAYILMHWLKESKLRKSAVAAFLQLYCYVLTAYVKLMGHAEKNFIVHAELCLPMFHSYFYKIRNSLAVHIGWSYYCNW